MSTVPPLTSTCRFCRYYSHQGRRGGTCQQLGGLVEANWQACPAAQGCFAMDEVLLEIQWREASQFCAHPSRPSRSPLPRSKQTAA
ncbi:MAG: hypothetical protein ACPGVO_17890 [Spirulinaceae cyanobacterium]